LKTFPEQRKGEFVLVIAGSKREGIGHLEKALELGHALQPYLSLSQAARVAAKHYDVSRRELYESMKDI
jgi:16S rRNA C1402 (ribose-2'-O) methylase RsmI